MTQESTILEDVPNLSSSGCPSDFNKAIASDHFEDGAFEDEDVDGADDDNISLGSEDNEYDNSDDDDDDEEIEEEELECNDVGTRVEQQNDDGDGDETTDEGRGTDEDCRHGSMRTAGGNDDARFCYTTEELHMLKLAHVEVSAVSNAKDLSRIHRAICDSNIF